MIINLWSTIRKKWQWITRLNNDVLRKKKMARIDFRPNGAWGTSYYFYFFFKALARYFGAKHTRICLQPRAHTISVLMLSCSAFCWLSRSCKHTQRKSMTSDSKVSCLLLEQWRLFWAPLTSSPVLQHWVMAPTALFSPCSSEQYEELWEQHEKSNLINRVQLLRLRYAWSFAACLRIAILHLHRLMNFNVKHLHFLVSFRGLFGEARCSTEEVRVRKEKQSLMIRSHIRATFHKLPFKKKKSSTLFNSVPLLWWRYSTV